MSICQDCHAGCCRSFAVPLTGADIIRIERDLKLTFWDFACRWADPSGAIARKYAPHFHFPDEPETPFVICINMTESQLFPGTTKCPFLHEDPPEEGLPLGRSHCSIHPSRPSACRVFPVKFNDTGTLPIVYEVPERGREDNHPAYKLCPRQWETSDVDTIDAVQDLAVARYEMTFFHQVASIWNTRMADWESFPEFLRLVYEKRVVHERDLAVDFPEAGFEGPRTIKLPIVHQDDSQRGAA